MTQFNRFLTGAEERQLFGHIRQFGSIYARRDHAWMRLARNTGLRVGTLAGLSVLDARRALSDGYLRIRPEIAKRSRAHTLHANRRAQRALRDLLAIRRDMGHAMADDEPLIVSRHNRGLSVRSFQARMRQWTKSAGLRVEATPHWWRHTLAMRLMRQSTAADPRGVVQAALNHSDISSTGVYTRPTREDVAQAMDEVAS